MQDLRSPDAMSNPRTGVAGALDNAAERLHDRADAMPGARMAAITARTADALDATGRYVREFDARDVMQDLGDIARRHPGKAMLGAIALGFLVGRAVTRPQA